MKKKSGPNTVNMHINAFQRKINKAKSEDIHRVLPMKVLRRKNTEQVKKR